MRYARMTSRKFRLSDAVILVAAVAVGFALQVRAEQVREVFLRRFGAGRFQRPYIILAFGWFGEACFAADGYIIPCAATLTLAITALTFEHHRGALGRVTRQPGASACIAASLAILLEISLRVAWRRSGASSSLAGSWRILRPHIHFVWSMCRSSRPLLRPDPGRCRCRLGILLLGGLRSRTSNWLELISRGNWVSFGSRGDW